MRDLYARVILWLIRPGLERREPEIDHQAVIDAVLKDLRQNGPIAQVMRTWTEDTNQTRSK